LDALFDGIAKHPAASEYWWTYALLLSSMIPEHRQSHDQWHGVDARDSVAGVA
jgi:hypothetical protein